MDGRKRKECKTKGMKTTRTEIKGELKRNMTITTHCYHEPDRCVGVAVIIRQVGVRN